MDPAPAGMESANWDRMRDQSYETNYTIGTRRSRKGALLAMAAAVLALAAVGVWLSPGGGGGLDQGTGLVRTETGNPGAVGTSGGNAGDADRTRSPAAPGGVIHELETITGSNDGHELVGRRVDLHVPVSQHINDVAFWVGMGDNRLLVVFARDDRDGAERQRGEPSNSGVAPRAGQQAAISGSIQRVPYAEAMYSWGLTNTDRAELMERRIYLRADTVTPAG
jgi:hypothetical protein